MPANKAALKSCLDRGVLSTAIPVLLKCMPPGCIILPEVKGTDLPLLLTWEFSLLVINVWIEDLDMHNEFTSSLGGGDDSVFLHRLLSIASSELNLLPTPGNDGRGKGLGGLGMYFPGICARSMRMFVAGVKGCGKGDEEECSRVFGRWEGMLRAVLGRIGRVDDVASLGAADCLWEVSRFM